jgi:hypothetical protein
VSNGTIQAAGLSVAADTTNSVGAMGTLTIDGGTVLLSSNLWIGSASFSTGQVFMTGGSLMVTNHATNAVLGVPSGTLVMNAGSIFTDALQLTNPAGQVTFNGGTLDTKNTTVANGAPFVVGDGNTPATLHLNGGTHVFAGGLVISANATLTGCGAVIGNIINHGTIATNCGGGTAVGPMVTFNSHGTTNLFSLPSVLGLTYTLEFKNSLNNAAWTPIQPSLPGSGGILLLQDPAATVPIRFYRVLVN